ncbi:unnamed protein product [Clavelina lepadiformis]|uniref:Uncharacterized protein n=1 Tax=Clavelina lepadiformis TaxID=159417 RepID=A0ABP0GDB8_CLALP
MAQATKSAASSVAECLDPAHLLQPSIESNRVAIYNRAARTYEIPSAPGRAGQCADTGHSSSFAAVCWSFTTSRITAFLKHILQTMKKLDLSGNNLCDDGASHISTCLSKIEKLDIGGCNISASGIKSISDAMSKLPEPRQAQETAERRKSKDIQQESNQAAQDSLRQKQQELDNTSIQVIPVRLLQSAGQITTSRITAFLQHILQTMKKLSLRGYDLGDDRASHISTCLSKIEELHIRLCNISASGIKSISDAISKLPEPMKKLNLSDIYLDDIGASHILTCLSKIEELDIGECNISESGIKSISDAISKLPEPIRYLNLSGNKFGDAGVPFVMSCLDKIEKLYMTDCNITEEGVRVITKHIKNCSNLPKVLEFNYDKMKLFSVLRCGLYQLDNGNFRNLDLTAVGWEALAAAINKLPQPGDITDENLERQECETTHREFSYVFDCKPTSIRSEQLRSKVNLRAAEPPRRRLNASTKHDIGLRSSPTVSPDVSVQMTKATDVKLLLVLLKSTDSFLGSAARISNQTPSVKQPHPSAVIYPPRLFAQPESYLSHYDDHCPQSTTGLQGPTESRVHLYSSHSKDCS